MVLKVIFLILFLASLCISGMLGWTLVSTGLLPQQIVVVAVGLLLLVPMLLFLLQQEKKGGTKRTGARVAATVLLLFFSIVELTALYFFRVTNRALDDVTAGQTQVTVVQVYVKEDDPAQTIEYAVETRYRFGTIAYMDEEAIEQARRELEQNYGRKVKLLNYATLLDLVRALDKGEVDALLISSAYLDLIDSLEDYASYAETLRSLHASDVHTEIQPLPTPSQHNVESATAEGLNNPDLWERSFCAYISGIDTYGPVTARSRSDVNIIAIVNPDTKTVLLISTPRDYYVPFNFVGGPLDKLTHAGIYGIEGSIQALNDFYGFPIQYYMRVNFTGFIKIIDTLGGVDVDNDIAFGVSGYFFDKGSIHLGGEAALRYARCRNFAGGDRVRGRHQMAVIKGVINGLVSSKLLTNYAEIMEELSGSFQTNAPKTLIGELVQLTLDRARGDWEVLTYSVDGEGTTDYAYSLGSYAYVMVPFMDTVEYAQELALAVASGEMPTQDEINENAPKHSAA